jgi:hypothetical protein
VSCNYVPPLTEQLHGPDPTAGSDCAICCARMAIMFATCGKVYPSPDKIRAQSGLDEPDPPGDYSTTITEYAKAVNAFDDEARDRGYPDGISAGVHERGAWDDLEPVLKAEEKWVTIFVDYGVLNSKEPGKSGDPGFDGSHAISVFGYTPASETQDGTHKYRIFDPLCDGRRSSIPKGPTYWKASTLRDAADAYAGGGSGTATWCTTPRSKASDPDPAPEPPDPCSTSYAADGRALLELVHEFLLHRQGYEARKLAAGVRRHQGDNPEGLSLPVHSGVTPDDG